ncbi:thioredoxin family protein [Flavobacterium sp.]|uniref:thioredoxin family protein n=1 Tax=Flavobacterium sp. TaxID=239 RepID=UPI0037500B87
MRKIFIVLFLTIGIFVSQAQEIKWLTIDEALALQKVTPKPIFMDVFTDWCGPCKMLDKQTFHDKAFVDEITANYYAVKFNAEGKSEVNFNGKKYGNPNFIEGQTGRNSMHEFTQFLKLQGYPTMVVFNKNGEIANKIVGYRNPEQLLNELKIK